MKICQLCTVDFTMFHFLLPLMRELETIGHDVIGACADGPFVDKIRALGFRVEVLPIERSVNPLHNIGTVAALRRLFAKEAFDLVHVHTPVAAATGRLAAIGTPVGRMVYTAHGFYFHEHMAWPKRARFVALEWILGRLTDTLFTQAEEDAQTARRLGLCKDVLAIGNGSDPAIFHPAADEAVRRALRRRLGAAEERAVILMIGRLVAEKGYPELFEAMGSVDADLWVVGDRLASDHAASIDAAIESVQADPERGPRVRFLGYRDDVPDLMRAADIFVLPSHREGMPRSIIEAMLSGLPVVATNIRGCREEVVDRATGLLTPLGDVPALATALRRLVGDTQARRRMGAAGLARARELYDEKKVVDRQIEHLGLALGQRAQKA
ncbi:MAG: glycosyltransferase family 4 protein [Alphaproteobacteria bacterium]|nr:glycosyltransferase family 4 protein [Alphaproteobacteria bacterium]MCZ6763742.1 glycosyltransferase family 4 protein [Alphaproteobacteria bacterium]